MKSISYKGEGLTVFTSGSERITTATKRNTKPPIKAKAVCCLRLLFTMKIILNKKKDKPQWKMSKVFSE